MFVFKMPVGVAQKIEKTEHSFMFSTEDSSLWKRVVCAKYGIEEERLIWDWQSSNATSFFVKVVANLLKLDSHSAKVIKEGIKVVIGCGSKVRFWHEVMMDSVPLKISFPRVFALATDKEGAKRRALFKRLIWSNSDLLGGSNTGKGSKEMLITILLNIKDLCVDSGQRKPGSATVGGVLRETNGAIWSSVMEWLFTLDQELLTLDNLAKMGSGRMGDFVEWGDIS
ncbi:hypothetical protein Dsin_015189 [Dipteronia sinensis]|uniref:Uncharacterized protein n=1 Tax=Dipteronia sinensis TaxID=43782 RepID=A0AAE0ABI9_9ROSI|nr:hypothetical protein Dsin_015189 [Dipteronia sinensis]